MASEPLMKLARALRQRQTDAEKRLWKHLRGDDLRHMKFRRQHPIPNTTFIADFCVPEAALIIEIDGGIHARQPDADALRQSILEALGYRVVRFSNEQVMQQVEETVAVILEATRRS